MSRYSPVTHVLFDMDGLILNTEGLYTTAFQNILSRFDRTYTFELKQKLMGLRANETATRIISELNLPMTADEFMHEANKHYQVLFPTTEILPGAQELIEHLHLHNIPIGLATSSDEKSYNLKAGNHQQLFSLFPCKTFGSDPDVKRGKPSPDIFLVAAEKFPDKPAPQNVVMVPDPRIDPNHCTDATLVLNSLVDFKPGLFGLPPF